jgi:hypothetical protein
MTVSSTLSPLHGQTRARLAIELDLKLQYCSTACTNFGSGCCQFVSPLIQFIVVRHPQGPYGNPSQSATFEIVVHYHWLGSIQNICRNTEKQKKLNQRFFDYEKNIANWSKSIVVRLFSTGKICIVIVYQKRFSRANTWQAYKLQQICSWSSSCHLSSFFYVLVW